MIVSELITYLERQAPDTEVVVACSGKDDGLFLPLECYTVCAVVETQMARGREFVNESWILTHGWVARDTPLTVMVLHAPEGTLRVDVGARIGDPQW